MLKIMWMFFASVFFINTAFAQKTFNVTIKLDSSVTPQRVNYQYYDGKNTVTLPDTFSNKNLVVLKSTYYSPSASLSIRYTDTANNYYSNDFFVNDKPATISFYCKANNENKLLYNSIKNAIPIYDTTVNKIWGKLQNFMVDGSMTTENLAFDYFLQHHKGFSSNDSLKKIFDGFFKRRINHAMSFFKKYPDDYFSFWYFIHQIAQPNGILSKDTAYLKEQLAYVKAVFPAKFTTGIEGKELIKSYETTLNPLKIAETAPAFTLTTVDGKPISLKSLKGKYVLLDFWATWCPPCMAEMPFIKEIRKNYPPEKLEIIGLNADMDLKPLIAAIKRIGMNWPQFYDRQKYMSKLYGINTFPTLILINPEGKIIYKSDHEQNDNVGLPKVLAGVN